MITEGSSIPSRIPLLARNAGADVVFRMPLLTRTEEELCGRPSPVVPCSRRSANRDMSCASDFLFPGDDFGRIPLFNVAFLTLDRTPIEVMGRTWRGRLLGFPSIVAVAGRVFRVGDCAGTM